jgi:hypothetical protein
MVVEIWSYTSLKVFLICVTIAQKNIGNVLTLRREDSIVEVTNEATVWSIVVHFRKLILRQLVLWQLIFL